MEQETQTQRSQRPGRETRAPSSHRGENQDKAESIESNRRPQQSCVHTNLNSPAHRYADYSILTARLVFLRVAALGDPLAQDLFDDLLRSESGGRNPAFCQLIVGQALSEELLEAGRILEEWPVIYRLAAPAQFFQWTV